MLVVFAPQIPLYGVAVVLYGVLQAHRRFAGPAVAPLVSSLVVIVAYLLFVPLSDGTARPGQAAEGRPSWRCRSGPASACSRWSSPCVGPPPRLGLRWRPTLRFPDGVAAQVRRLAAGRASPRSLAQQAAMVVVLAAGQQAIGDGRARGLQLRLGDLPAALRGAGRADRHQRVPAAVARRRRAARRRRSRRSRRAPRARSCWCRGVAAGVLAAASEPGSVVFLAAARPTVPPVELARAVALFAPGLIGYGLIAHLEPGAVRRRAGPGRGRRRRSLGWGVVMVAQTVFALALPDRVADRAGWRWA